MDRLARRSTQAELMDGEDISTDDYQRCLADLARVNKTTFTHRATLRWLDKAMRQWPAGTTATILDVAYGQGDLLRAIHRLAAKRGIEIALCGIDLNPRSAIAAARATPADMAIDYRSGDVFAYAPEPRPDFIVSSQFTHHLSDSQVVRFVQWLERYARRGWFIADLQRHRLAYYGYPLLARLARWHPIVRHDGTVSIARSFRRQDWQRLLERAGVRADTHWHMLFRLCVERVK